MTFLAQLEKATLELVAINEQVMDLTREFEEKYLSKVVISSKNHLLQTAA